MMEQTQKFRVRSGLSGKFSVNASIHQGWAKCGAWATFAKLFYVALKTILCGPWALTETLTPIVNQAEGLFSFFFAYALNVSEKNNMCDGVDLSALHRFSVGHLREYELFHS